jgi:hypothetical protein
LNKAQEILGMVLPADEDSALLLDPSEEIYTAEADPIYAAIEEHRSPPTSAGL